MKSTLLLLICALGVSAHASGPLPEIWAYLMKGEEAYFPTRSPITDVACFSAQVDGHGDLQGGHMTPPVLAGAQPGTRFHLVITLPWNTTIAHLMLNPDLPLRQRIIDRIVERARPFDGVQIDFESISPEDGTAYLNFLAAVKKALPKETCFSVAVMARWADHKKANPRDPFDYPFIGMIADRIIVMAYDEHYRGGGPGPIASLSWCRKIYSYACDTIPREKLLIGIPLYGRSWESSNFAKAYKNREIADELLTRGIKSRWHPETGGTYSFTESVTVTVHYETTQSLQSKWDLYSTRPICGVAYWRIGQEPDGFWNTLGQ